jgi:hypothetical protein
MSRIIFDKGNIFQYEAGDLEAGSLSMAGNSNMAF